MKRIILKENKLYKYQEWNGSDLCTFASKDTSKQKGKELHVLVVSNPVTENGGKSQIKGEDRT